MKELMEQIMENAEGNIYFFLSGDANAPNNSSTNLTDLIRKAKPIADILNRHINIYGFNPDEGMNFVVRVMPGGEISPDQMVTASAKNVDLVKCVIAKDDFIQMIKTIALESLSKEQQEAVEAQNVSIPKNPWLKKRQMETQKERSDRIGMDPDNNIFTPDEEETDDLRDTFGSTEDEIKIVIDD